MLRCLRGQIWILLAWSFLLPLRGQPAASSSPVTAQGAGSLPPDLQAELDALLNDAWNQSATVRASLGWRKNLLLSSVAPIDRTFGRAEIEAMLLRPMRDRWEFVSFLTGDVLRYFSPAPDVRGEQLWSLHTEGRWQPFDATRLALKAVGYQRDTVVDLSETSAERIVVPARVRGGYVALANRVKLPRGFMVEPAVQFKRSDFKDHPSDYNETKTGARLEWRHSPAFAVSAAWFDIRRPYAQRRQYNAGGRMLDNTHLRFHQREGELKVRSNWKGAAEWSGIATVARLENRDRAFGYFDYDQKRVRLELGWRRASWRVSLDGEAKRTDYLVQTLTGLVPPPRINDDYETTLRVERELNPRWTIFAEERWERSRSNEPDFNYRSNTVLAGLQRSF